MALRGKNALITAFCELKSFREIENVAESEEKKSLYILL